MYKVVYGKTIYDLEKSVNELLASRWELAGNLVVNGGFYQPMRKR